jgi:ubiquinone/menaquinone biosynthesis C-methylase UbiE
VSSNVSISFDRAASYYDSTRTPDEKITGRVADRLADRFRGAGQVLEVGVGTGQMALPMARRGVDLFGFDLSTDMMKRLRGKEGHEAIRLVRADATRMPFGDGSFGGAYARWVLHLISAWEQAVAEMDRVVADHGVIAIEPGGESGMFAEIYVRFVAILGDTARLPGLDPIDRDRLLDAAMERIGRRVTDVWPVTYPRNLSIAEQLERVPEKIYAWTWSVPDEDLRTATDRVRAWATAHFDIDAPQPDLPTHWRIYERAA